MPLIRMKACGDNLFGQLGDGTTIDRHVLTPVQLFALPIQVAGGGTHSLALLSDGTVWAWGNNNSGQLGDGTTTNRPTPVQVSGLTDVIAVAACGIPDNSVIIKGHSLALKSDGTVWAWGYNGQGQLGDGTTTNRPTPVQVSGLTDVIAVAAGGGSWWGTTGTYGFSLALKSDGTVWAWGYNRQGQLGDGTTTTRPTPVQVSGLTDVIAVAAGGSRFTSPPSGRGHSLALKSDGTVWAWGFNGAGQLGDGTTIDRPTPVQVSGLTDVIAVAAGGGHLEGFSLALKSDGTVWAWGYNAQGQLGDGTTASKTTPVQVIGLSDVTMIAAGGGHSLALKSNGTVWAWGYNGEGQLGDNSIVSRTLPVEMHNSSQTTGLATGHFNSTLILQGKQGLIFADPDGNQVDTHVLGQVLAGATLGPAGIDLYNGTGIPVSQVQVSKQNLPGFPDPDTVEISALDSPFTPEEPLVFSGEHDPEARIGTVWVRAQTQVEDLEGNPNQGTKTFDLSATSQPA